MLSHYNYNENRCASKNQYLHLRAIRCLEDLDTHRERFNYRYGDDQDLVEIILNRIDRFNKRCVL